jgi:hypothetical protein
MSLSRMTGWVGLIVLALAILLTGVWCALALWYQLPLPQLLREIAAALMIVLTIGTAILLCSRLRWRATCAFAVTFVLVCIWWATILPSNNRNWTPDVARNVTGRITGDQLIVQNVRNFNWRSDTDFDQKWEQRSYDLSKLSSVDLIMSYWAGEAIAHTIVSFGFSDGQRLDFSIETRKQQGQAYSTIGGFFKEYELIVIAADERDVIRVRSNIRGEDVRIYRLRMPPAEARRLLAAYIDEADSLAVTPRFYNTATANCTTVIYRLVTTIEPGTHWDPRILINGYLPDYIYTLGGLDHRIPFDQLRAESRIHDRALAAGDDPDFSAKIRVGIPAP